MRFTATHKKEATSAKHHRGDHKSQTINPQPPYEDKMLF